MVEFQKGIFLFDLKNKVMLTTVLLKQAHQVDCIRFISQRYENNENNVKFNCSLVEHLKTVPGITHTYWNFVIVS